VIKKELQVKGKEKGRIAKLKGLWEKKRTVSGAKPRWKARVRSTFWRKGRSNLRVDQKAGNRIETVDLE